MNAVEIHMDFIPRELDAKELALLSALIEAHRTAARENNNLSKAVAVGAYRGSGNFTQAACAGCLTIGGDHAPLAAARQVWRSTPEILSERLRVGEIVPGFGNSFFKDRVDPAFDPVLVALGEFQQERTHLVNLATAALDVKKIYMNAALITAAVCEILGVPDGLESAIFILARVPVWAAAVKEAA